jgi:transglutaminase-like putative cysteine protease
MLYQIRHVTRFDYAQPVAFARNNLRLKPIFWSGQTLEDYRLTIQPEGRTAPARAEAGLANVMRLVVEAPATTLTIESSARIRVDWPRSPLGPAPARTPRRPAPPATCFRRR